VSRSASQRRLTWAERRRRVGEISPAEALLSRLLDGYGVAREVREHRLVLQWEDIVGPRIAARSWPDGLREGELWVRVANQAWLQELSFLREQIVHRANEIVGAPPLVTKVRLHLGQRRQADDDDVVAALARRVFAPRRRRKPAPTPPTGPQLQQLQNETSVVEDPELRAAILAARTRLNL
jgi:hypothetical protein